MVAYDPLQTDGDYQYQGYISGNIKFGAFYVKVGARFSSEANPLYDLYVSYQKLYLQASTLQVKNADGNTYHQAIKINLGGATFGEMLEYLFHLLNPNLDMKLPAPWNILDSIKLSDFDFILDPTLEQYSIVYHADLNIGFGKADTVGLCLDCKGVETKLKVILTGNILGLSYTPDKPLAWDTLNGNPPEVPGKGANSFKLYYIGMGQYVKPSTDISSMKSIKDILAVWEKDLRPSEGGFSNPVKGGALRFDENADWMVGIDMALVNFIRLRILLQDPDIYGAQIALNGEQAGSLSGLNLEILYKKIRDDIGMFKVRLMLPEVFRHFELGIFSITLGVIDVEIYTNGNFMVDFGFPHKGDFKDSFGIQAAWWVGDGGVYFGVLSSETTNLVPAITNGRFDPVIAFGLGFRFGVGRTFSAGILKAGATLQLLAILEGVFAIYQPSDKAKKKDFYYCVKGSIGIVGRVYGEIDFKVIQVAVSLEVSAIATIIVEAYEKIAIALVLSIEAKASVRILFIKVSFEFSCKLSLDLSFGEKRNAPWRSNQLTQARSQYGGSRLTAAVRERSLKNRAFAAIYTWNPDILLFEGDRRELAVNITPIFSIDQAGVASDGGESYQVAFLLFANQSEVMQTSGQSNCFNSLLEAMAKWCLSAAIGSGFNGYLDYTTLVELREWLETAEAKCGFDAQVLNRLFAGNLRFYLAQVPIVSLTETESMGTVDGVLLPVFPELTYTYSMNGIQSIHDFSTYQPVNEAYEEELKEYFEKLRHIASERNQSLKVADGSTMSFASMIYSDYYYNLGRSCIDALVRLMEEYPVALTEKASLSQLVSREEFQTLELQELIEAGDCVASIAKRLGLCEDGLLFYNPNLEEVLSQTTPGQRIPITVGVTPQAVAIHNEGLIMSSSKSFTFTNFEYVVSNDDTLASIAEKVGTDASAILSRCKEEHILRSEASLTVSGIQYGNSTNLSKEQIAAVFYERYYHPDQECLSWYISTISALNTTDVPAGVIRYPVTYGQMLPTADWNMLPGDSIFTVASYLSLLTKPTQEFLDFTAKITMVSDQVYAIPAGTIRTGLEIPSTLQERLLCSDEELCMILQGADVLIPFQSIRIGQAVITSMESETLAGFAARIGITVEKLATYLVDEVELFDIPAGTSLAVTIPGVLSIHIPELLENFIADGESNIASQASRFFLQGLRIPGPGASVEDKIAAPLAGMYEWIGQQFRVDILADTPEEDALHLTVTKQDAVDWIQCTPVELIRLNKGEEIAYKNQLLYDEEVDVLDISYTKTQIETQLPGSVLTPDIVNGLQPMTPYHDEAYVINLGNASDILGTNHTLRLLNDTSILPLAGATCRLGALHYRVARNRNTVSGKKAVRYQINSVNPMIQEKQWGSAIRQTEEDKVVLGLYVSLSIRKTSVKGTYELYGVTEENREAVLAMSRLLKGSEESSGKNASLSFYYTADVADRAAKGIVPMKQDAGNTFLLKANLSTETKMVKQITRLLATEDVTSSYFSDAEDVSGFLRLIWECSTIGGGGFWLHLAEELPDNIFDETGNATLWLFASREDSMVYRADNCIQVDMGTDQVLECPDIIVRKSSLGTGEWGFEMVLNAFDSDSIDLSNPDERLRQLFQIVMYRLTESASYEGSGLSLPIFPVERDADWWYGQVIPLYRFFKLPQITIAPSLPPMNGNPYIGVDGTSQVEAFVNFFDVLGNSTADSTKYQLEAMSYYTTPILSPLALPYMHSTFLVEGGKVITTLYPERVTLGDHIASKEEMERYQHAYYQYGRDDVSIMLSGTIAEEDDRNLTVQILDTITAVWLTLNSRNACLPYQARETTFETYRNRYGISATQFASACGNLTLSEIFKQYTVPKIATFQNSMTLNELLAGDAVAIMQRKENVSLLFQSGIYVKTEVRQVTVQDVISFSNLALKVRTSIDSLVLLNLTKPDLFQIGSTFYYEGGAVQVNEEGITLEDICNTFAVSLSMTVTPLELIRENKDEDLIRLTAVLEYDDSLSDSLSMLTLATAGDIAGAINRNSDVRDIYPAGTVFVCDYLSMDTLTIEEACKVSGCDVDYLINYNLTASLIDDFQITIAGIYLPPTGEEGKERPYYAGSQSMSSIAALFGMDTIDLAEYNRIGKVMNGTGQTITVNGHSVPCPTGTFSLQQLFELFSGVISFSDMVNAIAEDRTLVRESGLWVVSGDSMQGQPVTVQGVADISHIEPYTFMESNAGLVGLLKEGESMELADSTGATKTVTILENDTFSTVLARLDAQGAVGSYRELAASNGTKELLQGDAWYFLPPRDLVLTQDIISAPLQEPIWEIGMSMNIQRNDLLVHEDFRDTEGYVAMSSRIPPYQEKDEEGNLSYEKLAEGIENALPYVRVLSGQRKDTSREELYALQFAPEGLTSLEVVSPVEISIDGTAKRMPRYFALRPLSTELVSRDSMVLAAYDQGNLIEGGSVLNYHNIDMELWARQFLSDFDTLLTSDYYTGIYTCEQARQTLDAIIACKLNLAEAVASGIGFVLDIPGNDTPEVREKALTQAAATLEQVLRSNLSNGYATDVIAQYDVIGSSVWKDAWAPRLDGNVSLEEGNDSQESIRIKEGDNDGQENALSMAGCSNGNMKIIAGDEERGNMLTLEEGNDTKGKAVNIAGGKISLQDSESCGGRTFTHLLLRADRPEFQKTIPLSNVTYVVGQFECDRSLTDIYDLGDIVQSEEGFIGYEGSNHVGILTDQEALGEAPIYENSAWLKFVLPFRQGSTVSLDFASQVPAPVPLRLFPSVPEVKNHIASRSNENPVNYMAALNWDYQFSYRHEQYEQDRVHVQIDWNVDSNTLKAISSADLFAALAQYVSVRTMLLQDLSGFLNQEVGSASINALESFRQMSEDITARWKGHFQTTALPLIELTHTTCHYVVERITKASNDPMDGGKFYIDKMQVTREQTDPFSWPQLLVVDELTGDMVPLRREDDTNNQAVSNYYCDAKVEVTEMTTVILRFVGQSVKQYQNAKGGVYVKRNEEILKDIKLSKEFIFETAKAETPSEVSPYLTYRNPFHVGTWSDSISSNPLKGILSELTGDTSDIGISMEVRYGVKIADADGKPVHSYIPMYFIPNTYASSISADRIVQDCVAWCGQNDPVRADGVWQFEVTLYSTMKNTLPLCSLLLEMTDVE
ncbi:MAG TPA: LysM peptidoglycan-binding domain-containing protein [Lachnospiraceae bacterium]|nr:LysM peptidoglycan-binding domain-containing protein [Lachnospiraceae bacterium]